MWDVVVVGAGPAGSSAAYFLAQAGIKVALLDRQIFPRDKVCGDGVSAEGLAILAQMGLATWVTQEGFCEPHTLLLSGPNGSSVAMDYAGSPSSYGRVIPRRVLDESLAKRASEAGAHLVENCHVRSCERIDDRGIRISGAQAGHSRSYEARLLILAEGAQAILARQLGLTRGAPDLVAVRGYFVDQAQPCDTLEIHYGRSISPGYAWVFPLGNGVANVGVGTFAKQIQLKRLNLNVELKRVLTENPYLKRRLKDSEPLSAVKGFPLRTDLAKGRLCDDSVLVAGEAAHLVNPLTGEGIASALVSGQLAARQAERALQKGDFSTVALSPYAHQVQSRFAADHRAALLIRRLLARPAVMNHIIRQAQGDKGLALALGLVIIGANSPRALLRPSMIVRYLF